MGPVILHPVSFQEIKPSQVLGGALGFCLFCVVSRRTHPRKFTALPTGVPDTHTSVKVIFFLYCSLLLPEHPRVFIAPQVLQGDILYGSSQSQGEN